MVSIVRRITINETTIELITLTGPNEAMDLLKLIPRAANSRIPAEQTASSFIRDYVYAWARSPERIGLVVLKKGGEACCAYCVSLYRAFGLTLGAVRMDIYFYSPRYISESLSHIREKLHLKKPGLVKLHYSFAQDVCPDTLSRHIGDAFNGWGSLARHDTHRDRIELASTYDQLLRNCGYKTRRNMKLCERKIIDAQFKFEPNIHLADCEKDIRDLGKVNHPVPPSRILQDTHLRILKQKDSALISAIYNPAGALVSVAGGWLLEKEYYMMFQYNHSEYKRFSFGLSHFAILARYLIGLDCERLTFLGGISGPLSRYCSGHEYYERWIFMSLKSYFLFRPLARFVGDKSGVPRLAKIKTGTYTS